MDRYGETALYRIAQEPLTNVRKHADTTRVSPGIGRLGREVRLRVRDRGRGVSGAGMLLGGAFEVMSRPGGRSFVVARVPFDSAGEGVEDG